MVIRFGMLLACAFAAAALSAGCGSSSSGSGTTQVTASSVSTAEFKSKAESVCESGSKQIELDYAAFLKEKGSVKNPSKAVFEELVAAVVTPNVEREIEEISEIGAPSGEVDKVQAIVDTRQESIDLAEADPEAVVHNSKKIFAKASKTALEYGLPACATR